MNRVVLPVVGASSDIAKPLLLCFSHLRWDFVFQRPQHLMRRFTQAYRVMYWEEPFFDAAGAAYLELRYDDDFDICVARPHLAASLGPAEIDHTLAALLVGATAGAAVAVRWYYTPMMLRFSRSIVADRTVYDCMDELANFRFAPPDLLELEQELLDVADVVFTGGFSLYEAKRGRHADVRPFPSSVDVAHFGKARNLRPVRADDAPVFGFYGVVDERMDLALLAALAAARPDWTIEIVGPVVKIDPAELPQAPNLHYLGGRDYDELPATLARWDVALMPFAINAATRFISPTKTPEYLAGGRPVVSTPIVDVVRHYGALDGVIIGDTADAFVAGCAAALALARGGDDWRDAADLVLGATSWDATAAGMLAAIRGDRPETLPVGRAVAARYDFLVVGAGFAGSVMAERLARDGGYKVLVVDRRPHVAGNAFDVLDTAGVLIHQYGPHIFHTNSTEIVDYLSRFTAWRRYEHRVLAEVDGQRVPIPINRTTLNAVYGLSLTTDAEAAAFLEAQAEPVAPIVNSEDVVVSAVGRDLYEKFFRGYTRKQWGLDPSELDKAVTARVPTRTSTDDRYFNDSFQAMPAEGFTRMFERMLDHPNIDVMLGEDFAEVSARIGFGELIYTGPIDEYFGHRHGKLPYRSLRFRHETVAVEQFQQVAVVNYPDEAVPYTRVTEYKHLTGQQAPVTSITYEYPAEEGDPYYPIPREENQRLFKRYEALALAEAKVTFVGRLATYRYYNMDQVVGQALATYRRLITARRPAIDEEAVPAPAAKVVQQQ